MEKIDYVVPPLDGLWWAHDMNDFVDGNRSRWLWTLMIMQPEVVTQERFRDSVELVKATKNPTAVEKVEFQLFSEGTCAQVLHVGPFSEEGPTVERVHRTIEEKGHSLAGKHHEIYLSDVRRVSTEKYRTIIRQPLI